MYRVYFAAFFLHLVLFSPSLFSQTEDLTEDKAFFEDQAKVYQRWLDHTGLGKVLHVREIGVKPEQLSLYLEFPYNNIDSIINAWNRLKVDFESLQPISLEQQLFYKMTALMEVRQSLADVQIYDTYDTRIEPLFFRGIYFEEGQVKVEESNPMSKIVDLDIDAAELMGLNNQPEMEMSMSEMLEALSKLKDGEVPKSADGDLPIPANDLSIEDFQKLFSAQVMYNRIYAYARERYGESRCENRFPAVGLLENGDVLRFEVTDLCKEVLVDESKSSWCKLVNRIGINCNTIKRELLTFIIKYKPTETGINLNIEIDGKFGSGLYSTVRRGGYHSMEVDFDEYLDIYAQKFIVDLKQYLMYGSRP